MAVTEPFTIYIKASLLVGALLASPWIFWQIWHFVAAGLYPHERRYVHRYLPFSLGLFFAGAALAFFVVFEPVLNFLLKFNRSQGIVLEPRINEWLGFVLILPLGFGIGFQLPLVMLFLERIGVFTVRNYLAQWRIAVLVIFVVAAVLTPPDLYSMLLLAMSLTFLYFGGILLCKVMPRQSRSVRRPGRASRSEKVGRDERRKAPSSVAETPGAFLRSAHPGPETLLVSWFSLRAQFDKPCCDAGDPRPNAKAHRHEDSYSFMSWRFCVRLFCSVSFSVLFRAGCSHRRVVVDARHWRAEHGRLSAAGGKSRRARDSQRRQRADGLSPAAVSAGAGRLRGLGPVEPHGHRRVARWARRGDHGAGAGAGPMVGIGPSRRRTGALLVACDPILLAQSAQVMTETLATFLAMAGLVVLAWAFGSRRCGGSERPDAPSCRRRLNVWKPFLAGAILGLGALCRPTLLLWTVAVGRFGHGKFLRQPLSATAIAGG